MSNLMGMRNEYKDLFAKRHGVKLGFMSAFVKASASALREMPVINSGARWLRCGAAPRVRLTLACRSD